MREWSTRCRPPAIDGLASFQTYINHSNNGQFRLSNGTLARRDPQPETLWLDDLYMSVPPLGADG
jgi:hypothetical protein